MKKITSGDFEQFCLCFSIADICKIRLGRLRAEHRKELYLSKIAYEKCIKLRSKNLKKALEYFAEYEKTYFAEWKKLYDFDIGIELFECNT